MRISHFFLCVGIITLACLVYVWQNVCQMELSYQLLTQEKQITKLVDQNRVLRYNVLQLKSPAAIEKSLLAGKIKLKYTTPVMIAHSDTESRQLLVDYSQKPSFRERTKKALSAIFAFRSEVEARP